MIAITCPHCHSWAAVDPQFASLLTHCSQCWTQFERKPKTMNSIITPIGPVTGDDTDEAIRAREAAEMDQDPDHHEDSEQPETDIQTGPATIVKDGQRLSRVRKPRARKQTTVAATTVIVTSNSTPAPAADQQWASAFDELERLEERKAALKDQAVAELKAEQKRLTDRLEVIHAMLVKLAGVASAPLLEKLAPKRAVAAKPTLPRSTKSAGKRLARRSPDDIAALLGQIVSAVKFGQPEKISFQSKPTTPCMCTTWPFLTVKTRWAVCSMSAAELGASAPPDV